MCSINGPLRVDEPKPLPKADPLPIYLDYNATTPLEAEVWEAMCSVQDVWGNPSSTHPFGLAAKFALEEARSSIASALDASIASDVILTSGGTESNNLAIIGGALANRSRHPERTAVVLSNVEHPAVENVATYLQTKESFELYRVPVNQTTGVVDVDAFSSFLLDIPGGPQRIALVTVMFANNEIGSVNPIKDLCRKARELCGSSVLFHTDAAQAIGKVRVSAEETGVDFLSVCGHKFYAPKGSGALYIRDKRSISGILHGAGHEYGLRPGTENVLFATGLAKALTLVVQSLPEMQRTLAATRDEVAKVLKLELKKFNMDYYINGDLAVCLPNTLNCALFKNVPDLLHDLPVTYICSARLIQSIGSKVCLSAGSACHSALPGEEVHVSAPLAAINVDIHRAIGTLRISTGKYLSMKEARHAAVLIARHAAQQFAE